MNLLAAAFVLVILPELGSDDYDRRAAASVRLEAVADYVWPYLPASHPDPEIRRRLRAARERVVPVHPAPIGLLGGTPLAEWTCLSPGGSSNLINRVRPTPAYSLSWLRPDPYAPIFTVVRIYGERTRTQSAWRDWQLDADGREATRLLAEDALRLGVPAFFVRRFLALLAAREAALDPQPAKSYP